MICTLGELQAAVDWMNADALGRVQVVYSLNGRHTARGFKPDGTIGRDMAVAVQWHRPGEATRLIGKFRTIDGAQIANAPLRQIGNCPVMRWVILFRLLLSDCEPN